MNKPNLYNFFKFIETKTGQTLKRSYDQLRLKVFYAPDKLTEEDLEKLPDVDFKYTENLPEGFSKGLPIKKVTLYGEHVTSVPTSLSGINSLTVQRCNNLISLPPLELDSLHLWKCAIENLPQDLKVNNLFLDDVAIRSIPDFEYELRLLVLSNLVFNTLEGVKVRSLYLQGGLPYLKRLPENFTCGLTLQIEGDTALTSLPKGLKVNHNLYLLCEPQFDRLPDDLEVGNDIIVYTMPTYCPEHLKDKIKVKERK